MQIQGSDCLDYQKALDKGMELIRSGDNPSLGLLVVCGINMGLRISDLLTIEYGQLKSGKFIVNEKKTQKSRIVFVNSNVRKALELLPVDYHLFEKEKVFTYSPQHINRMLKKYFTSTGKTISSHSLRKTFGRRYYRISIAEGNGKEGLTDLQLQFNHANPEDTLKYIGVTQERLNAMYEKLV